MGAPGDTCPEPADGHVGRKAVELGLITEMQLRDVLAKMASTGGPPSSLSSALVRLGLLTQRQLDALHDDTAAIRKKFGKYSIVRQLGRGGMGVVFEAIDPGLGRTVALKMLLNNPTLDANDAALDEERFIREARLSANLPKHPGIVGVYESGIHEGRRYIAMEYIEGCHFEEWCAKSTGSLRGQISILRDVALAVDHAHRHGVIHRDLKPANVLVDTKGFPHVTDFGLAKQIRQDASLTLTGGGKVIGTPSYISPEQASGRRDVDRRTDVWAMGVMLYELLAGRPPFRGETPIDIMMKAVQNPVPLPSSVVRSGPHRSFDRAIENICLKALAKNPNQRYSTAKSFADDMSRWLKGEKVEVTTSIRRKSRGPVFWVAGLAAAAVVVILAVVVSSPSASETAALQKKDRAEALVVQGQRLLNQGKNSDALVAFGQASDLDPENRPAASGKREAERRIAASHAPPPPSPREPIAPPPPVSPRDTLRKASEFSSANPRDIEGQIRVWREAQAAVAGTPFAAEAARELEAAIARRRQAVTGELQELDRTVEALREAESFGAARDILAQAAKRHQESEWVGAVQDRQEDLRKRVDAAYGPIKDQALEARRKEDKNTIDACRTRVARWKWLDLAADLDEALAKVAVPDVPTPAPLPAVPARLTGAAELPAVEGHKSGICATALSPDGKLLISASFDMTVRLWDLTTRAERMKLVEGVLSRSVGFSPDGKWMAAGFMDGSIKIWETVKFQERTLSGHTLQAIGIAFSPDSKILASASTDGTVRLWDPVAGSQKSQLEGHPKGAMAISWSPDGKLLAVGCADRQVKLWEMPAGRERRVLTDGLEGTTLTVAFSRNGKTVVSSGEQPALSIWDIETGKRRVLAGHTKEVRQVSCSPDGLWIASVSADGTLRLWDAASGEARASFPDSSAFFAVAFSRKGDVLAGCSGAGFVRLWDLSAVRPAKGESR